jgi:hypothetical protein
MDWMLGGAVLGALVAGAVLRHVFAPALGEYGKRKGQNLADKEDIAKLTKLVESVKQENALVLENVRSRQQLRIAAAERRLQAHQEAYALWRRLIKLPYGDSRMPALVTECQQWWDSNCIYLNGESRLAFQRAYFSAMDRYILSQVELRDDGTSTAMKEAAVVLNNAGPAIVRGAELPTLGDAEGQDVTARAEPDSAAPPRASAA